MAEVIERNKHKGFVSESFTDLIKNDTKLHEIFDNDDHVVSVFTKRGLTIYVKRILTRKKDISLPLLGLDIRQVLLLKK